LAFYSPIILDLLLARIFVYLSLQPYSVQYKRIKMTQEAIQLQIESLRRVAEKINTPEAARQFLIDAGIIKMPRKNKKAKRLAK
jgi:hypothetical protein